jgi:putative hemolysin
VSLLLVLAGLLLAAIGATTGVAVVASSRLELTRWAARRLAGADAAITLLSRPGDILSVAHGLVAIGVSVAGVAAPWALQHTGLVPTLALELGVGLPLVVLLVYFLPRAIGRRWPEAVVRGVVPHLRPASAIVGRIVRGRVATERAELAALLRNSTSEGLAREDELEIVSGVMAFAERTVREVMTPRTRIVAASERATTTELAELVSGSGYTRIPLTRSTLDDVVGMAHAFDLLKAGPTGSVTLRPVAVLPSTRRCADALLDLKRERRHLAVVLDEYGGTAGLVTMEDLLEELVGEIFDELDERVAPPQPAVPGVLVADATTPLVRVIEHFGVRLDPPPRVETAGGYLAWAAGRILHPGERLVVGGLEWDVVEGTAARVGRVVIRMVGPAAVARGPVS